MESIVKNKNNQLSLKWNGFTDNIITSLELLLNNQDFVDVTLVCEEGSIKAHRLVLSTCSSFFRRVLKENVCPHPVIVLKGVTLSELETLLMFIYHGEARTCEESVPRLLEVAQFLEITGLSSHDSSQISPDPASSDKPKENINNIDNDFLQSGVHSTTHEFMDLFSEVEKCNPGNTTTSLRRPGENERQENNNERIDIDIIKQEPLEEEPISNGSKEVNSQTVSSPIERSSKPKAEDKDNLCLHKFNFSVQEMVVLQQQRRLPFYEPRPCPRCHRTYRDAATLRNHLASMHEVLRHKVSCSCGLAFPTKHDLHMHRKRDHKGAVGS